MALKLPDSAVPMGDFPVAKAVDIDFDDGENLQEKLDNGKLGGEGNTTDLTDLENRVTTNETNITGLQEQIDNLDIPEDVDLTDINTKLTQLETNQIKKTHFIDMRGQSVYCKIPCPCYENFSKILMIDYYGGSILITGATTTNDGYKAFKVIRLSNGYWYDYSPSNNLGNKIENVYLDDNFIYVKLGGYIKVYIEGGFTNVEKIETLPTEVTELPILDLTQQTDLTSINTKLTQLENTINEVGGGGIYQSGEIEVGTWTGGQKLYRYTISDTTERTFSNGTMMLDFFTLSRDEHVVVKLDGTFRMCAINDNSGAHTVYALPYVDLDTNRQVHLVYTTQDRVRLSGKNLKDYKILGFDVSIYYYKK